MSHFVMIICNDTYEMGELKFFFLFILKVYK